MSTSKSAVWSKVKLASATFLIGSSSLANALTLNVLEWEGYISDHKEAFEQYAQSKGKSITLNFVKPYVTNPEQIFKEVRSKKADVVTPTHNYFKMRSNQLINVLLPLDTNKISSYNHITGSLRKASYDKHDNGVYSVPLLGGSYGLAYNAGKNVSAPDSWEALWKPEAKGQFAITQDQVEANVYITMMALGYPPETFYDISGNNSFNKDQVQAKLNALVKNAKNFWGGLADPNEMKNLKYVTTYWFGPAIANKEGQNWLLSNPKEGQTVWLDTMSIAKHVAESAEKLEAAYMLLDFMISPEVQAKIFRSYGSVIVNPKASSILSPEEVKKSYVGDESFFEDKFFWKPLTSRTKGTYQQMWKNAIDARGN